MRREIQWEATVARLQQQLAQLKGESSHKAAEDAAEGQAKQLNSIRSPSSHQLQPCCKHQCMLSCIPTHQHMCSLQAGATLAVTLQSDR